MWLLFSIVGGISVYFSLRYAWWKPAISYRNPRILMYHMIKKHTHGKFRGLRVAPEMFERQIRYLKENGWYFATMSELANRKTRLPEKTVVITFDDGYEDNYTHAFPILKKYQAKATLYIVVDRHEREWSGNRKIKNRTGELMREPKLSDGQIREMARSGLFEIGSHTLTHPNLPTLSLEEKRKEICHSKKIIEEYFYIRCNAFCYPFGLFDERDVTLVEKAGYTSATTTQQGIEELAHADMLRLRRITVSGKDNFFAFKMKLRTGKRGVFK